MTTSTKAKTPQRMNKAVHVETALKELGLDLESELSQQQSEIRINPPRVRIEHSSSGRHRMFIDLGESYFDSAPESIDIENNHLEGIVAIAQPVRALFQEGESLPICAAIENTPTVQDPISKSCIGCPEAIIGSGRCKAKIRLFLVTEYSGQPQVVVFPLSPTSIKRWRSHLKRLQRSKLPYIAVHTLFSLLDIERGPYRYAEVNVQADRLATKEEIAQAVIVRQEYASFISQLEQTDFSDPGDKQSSDKAVSTQ